MLRLENISFNRNKPILVNIGFSVKPGKMIGLVGASGSGKTTLLKIIAGLLDSDSGNVFLHRERIKGPSEKLIPGHDEIQLVNQDFALDLYHTVHENLRVKAGYLPKDLRDELVEEMLELLDLIPLRDQKAHTLSGGEQQRLALGRALCLEPAILLLDEPFAHLDVHIRQRVVSYLLELKKRRKTTFILVSHDGNELLSLADEIAFFAEGEIKRWATPEEYYLEPSSKDEALFFGEINEIKIHRKKLLFRPNAFSLTEGENQLEVKFKTARFRGAFYENDFTFGKQQIKLYSSKPMTSISTIYV